MVNQSSHNLWIGLIDQGKEGVYRLVNGTLYDAFDKSKAALYYWEGNEPNNKDNQDCAHFWHTTGGLGDDGCNDYTNLDGKDGRDVHGLCEIKSYNCLDE